MRSSLRLALAAAAVLSLSASLHPVWASCPPGYFIESGSARLISNPEWCGGEVGCYGDPPVSTNLDGFFWGQTAANGARSAGVDSGRFLIGSWTQSHAPWVGDGVVYYYNVYLARPVVGGSFGWADPGVDNCINQITPETPNDECTCVALTDSWNGHGYMALLSAQADFLTNFWLFPRGVVYTPVVFGQIPRPVVTNTMRDPANGDITFTVAVPTPLGGAGDYRSPPCDCAIGFRIYQQVVVNGEIPSTDRWACTQDTLFRSTGQSIAPNDPGFNEACEAAGFVWVPALDPSGAPQSFTPFGPVTPTAAVKVPCGDPAMVYDIYLAVSLGTNEGPGQIQFPHVGANSFQVSCSQSSTIAEPHRPRRPEAPQQFGSREPSRGGRER